MTIGLHGHFYQPPREDPLTGAIPEEPGAQPFHDWNQKIDDSCYKPNASEGNFSNISFNIGPTLFEWLRLNDTETYNKIIHQDIPEKKNAIAQSYNHTILPLAKTHDKIIQVKWGIADFVYRFNRQPAGMWLPETAVDKETLDVLVQNNIEFTILAPWQIEACDKGQPYNVQTTSGNIVIFPFQDISGNVSFDDWWTENADRFIEQIFPIQKDKYFLIATDGELYGEHKRLRDLFLNYLTTHTIKEKGIEMQTPWEYMQTHPNRQNTSVFDNTSWSCHSDYRCGITRWEDTCGCAPNQNWKRGLRNSLNLLGEAIDGVYLAACKGNIKDPWRLVEEYIHVMQGDISEADLIKHFASHKLDETDIKNFGLLLKSQKEKQRMYTSCGWFFDDFDRIEPKNNVAYAASANQLTYLATGNNVGKNVLPLLENVVGNNNLVAAQVFRKYTTERVLIYE